MEKWALKPEDYLGYLREKSWAPRRQLGPRLIMSFWPRGLSEEVWSHAPAEKLIGAKLKSLSEGVDLLYGFGMGGPAARQHLGLAIAGGVKNLIVVGTVGSMKPQWEIGQLVLAKGGDFNEALRKSTEIPEASLKSIFDLWEEVPDSDLVDMEYQWISTWCQKNDVTCSFLGVVSDQNLGGDWVPGFDRIGESLDRAHQLAFEFLKGMEI